MAHLLTTAASFIVPRFSICLEQAASFCVLPIFLFFSFSTPSWLQRCWTVSGLRSHPHNAVHGALPNSSFSVSFPFSLLLKVPGWEVTRGRSGPRRSRHQLACGHFSASNHWNVIPLFDPDITNAGSSFHSSRCVLLGPAQWQRQERRTCPCFQTGTLNFECFLLTQRHLRRPGF